MDIYIWALDGFNCKYEPRRDWRRYYLAITQLMYPCIHASGDVDGGCFDPLSICVTMESYDITRA